MKQILTRGIKEYIVDVEKGYIKRVGKNRNAVAKCHPDNEFDLDFGIELADARLLGNKELENKLIDEKYPKKEIKESKIIYKQIEKLEYSNMDLIFGVKIPEIQERKTEIITKIKDGDVECKIIEDLFGKKEYVGVCDIFKCNGNLMNAISIAEVRAKQKLYEDLERMLTNM